MARRSLITCILDKLFRRKRNLSKQLVADLSFVTPEYLKNMTEKYGDRNWTMTAEQMGRKVDEYLLSWYEENKSKIDGNETKNA